ncbi:MAG: hypothetical protein ABL903_19930, partial [Methylococcales bacterium]
SRNTFVKPRYCLRNWYADLNLDQLLGGALRPTPQARQIPFEPSRNTFVTARYCLRNWYADLNWDQLLGGALRPTPKS